MWECLTSTAKFNKRLRISQIIDLSLLPQNQWFRQIQNDNQSQWGCSIPRNLRHRVVYHRKGQESLKFLPNSRDTEKNAQTLSQYSYNRYFRERYLPESGFTYGAVSEEPKENPNVSAARFTINILKANDPNDPNIQEIKEDLKKRLGTNDLSPYGL